MSRSKKNINPSKRLAVTIGDPAGIGPEITLKAMNKVASGSKVSFVIIGEYAHLKKLSQKMRIPFDYKKVSSTEEAAQAADRIVVLDVVKPSLEKAVFGKDQVVCAKAAKTYIDIGVDMCFKGICQGVVTGPISKSAMRKAKLGIAGHTEYLAKLCGKPFVVMLFYSDKMKLSLVTRHVQLSKVSSRLTVDNIADTIDYTVGALKSLFGIKKPEVLICGLNPHAGDKGLYGDEEQTKIIPAIKKVSRKHKDSRIIGPLASEAVFYKLYKGQCDGAVAMYHDQALGSFKMVARDDGVNVTIGIDFVRTSPDHGTAYDIAGKGIADCGSMLSSVKLAMHMLEVAG